jgi:hypothetical protein
VTTGILTIILWPSKPLLVVWQQENSDVLGGCGKETAMIRSELGRRMKAAFSLGSAVGAPPKLADAKAAVVS